jgi:3-methyl-2-oxobutanoate hydroxymethyltransferase
MEKRSANRIQGKSRMSVQSEIKKVTTKTIRAKKGKEKIACLTAYDYPMARYCEDAGVDVVLVGDSLGNVIHGEPSTLPVTMDMMLLHTRAVARAVKRSLLVADLPFLSYHASAEQAVMNAGRFLKESYAEAVKLEGGLEMEPIIAAIVRAGIPVMAHIGLTPQSVHAMGGYRMHGKTPSEREVLIENAKAVERAGAFSVVLECIEENVAREITELLKIPTIGIGSGNATDGQILVTHDLLGLTVGPDGTSKVPSFVAQTGQFRAPITEAIKTYVLRTKESS